MVLKSGEKAPDLNFKQTGDTVSWKTFKNKFVYLHFNPEDKNSLIEIEPLISLHKSMVQSFNLLQFFQELLHKRIFVNHLFLKI